MGALAPVSPWLPEDDLLLKNSIEAGASLESLAKGAVQFSRKFTVRELQDRWHSLLYDPVVSAEASFRMIDSEHTAPILPSKLTRAGNSKENKSLSGKRKAESVRSCYYALRKRIHNEPFSSMDLSFLNNGNFFGNGDEALSGSCMLGDPMSNHFGIENSNLDVMHHTFPEIPTDDGVASRDGHTVNGFHGGLDHPIVEEFSMHQSNINGEIPRMFDENPSFTGNGSGVEELDQPRQLPSFLEADCVEANPPTTYGQINGHPGNVCLEFEGNQVFDSTIPECGASFHNLEYSSPLPEMPIWRTVENISSPTMPADENLREKGLHAGDTFALPDDADAKDTSASGYDFVHANSKLKMQMSCDKLKSSAAGTEGYLEELSNSLLNFTNDEELFFMDIDGKEMIDKSYYDGLSSLLLNSPSETKQDHMPSPVSEISASPDYLTNTSAACPAKPVEKSQMLPSAAASDPQSPKQNDRFIYCMLNTEDPDIPCNDDIVLPIKSKLSASVGSRQNFKEACNPFSSSVKDFSRNKKVHEDPILMKGGQENPGQYHASAHMTGSQLMPEKSQLLPVGDCGSKFELPNCDSLQLACRTPSLCSGSSVQTNSMIISTESLQCTRLKEENKETAPVKEQDKPAFGSDGYKSYERNTNGIKQELNDASATEGCQASNAEVGSIQFPDSDPVVNHPTSEPEEQSIESDGDVPYFSDIEAMILDMDLDPGDQEIYEQEVSKYQHEDTRRAIVRLEQGAHSFMQRAIASHGAFAILYGRHSKHYIKKPEVLLGRATEDIVVDIDLGREGRSNKVSRRQAIINMDDAGSFHLKNLGKFSILVNNKEVSPGQSLTLSSSCLIEIRGMPFVFEANQTCIKRYLDIIGKGKPSS